MSFRISSFLVNRVGFTVRPSRAGDGIEREKEIRIGKFLTEQQQVDVARGRVALLRDRAVHERGLDPVGHGLQRFTQRARESEGLAHDAAQFLVDRRLRIGLVVLLIAHARHREQPAVGQLLRVRAARRPSPRR
ncbi:hypothetical protein ACHMXE_18435 [Variovorax sp. UC122_21]